MGRYANFSTGFQYKFAFGVQSSGDIMDFGGSTMAKVELEYLLALEDDDKTPAVVAFLALHQHKDEVLLSKDEADELPEEIGRSYITEWIDVNDTESKFILEAHGAGLPVPDWNRTQDTSEFDDYVCDLYNINNDNSALKYKLLLGALIVFEIKREGGVLTAWWNYE